ncbi:MAG: hypothetical protein ACI9OJ_004098 [Myxococcota bacterium]|jgi:hypothetical protein
MNVIVRLIHDPVLVDALYADSNAALADTDLDAQEIGWLLAADRRAWQTDEGRRSRAISGLADEYPVSLTVLKQAKGDPESFFSSPLFHASIMAGDSLSLTFGHWLMSSDNSVAGAKARLARRLSLIAAIERAGAMLRRAQPPPPGDALCLAHTVGLLESVGGALALFEALRLNRRPLPTLTGVPETLLLENGPSGLTYEVLPEGLRALLMAAQIPQLPASLIALAESMGSSPIDARDLVGKLTADGVLRACDST